MKSIAITMTALAIAAAVVAVLAAAEVARLRTAQGLLIKTVETSTRDWADYGWKNIALTIENAKLRKALDDTSADLQKISDAASHFRGSRPR